MRDPQSGGGGASGSTGTLPFSADGKYEGTTSTQAQPQQQGIHLITSHTHFHYTNIALQQQQAAAHNQLNHPFYGQFPYLMYAPPMGMAAATGYSAQPVIYYLL